MQKPRNSVFCYKWVIYITHREADRDIALLADGLGAYVLSNDSDFCIYNTNYGFINLSSINKTGKNPYTGRVVTYKNLATYLCLDHKKLPLLSLLCGNDYFQTFDLGHRFPPNLAHGTSRILSIVRYINKFPHENDLIEDFKKILDNKEVISFNQRVRIILKYYNLEEEYDGFLRSEIQNKLIRLMKDFREIICDKWWETRIHNKKEWLTKKFDTFELSKNFYGAIFKGFIFLSVPPQSFELRSVNETTVKIRAEIYKLMSCDDNRVKVVREFDRIGYEYKELPSVKIESLSALEIKEISTNNLNYFYNKLGINQLIPHISFMTSKSEVKDISLVLFSLKYVSKFSMTKFDVEIIKVFLLGVLRSLFLNTASIKLSLNEYSGIKTSNPKAFHLIGEYVATYGCICTLNFLLGKPFPEIPKKFRIDGPLIVDTFNNLSTGKIFNYR